MPSEPDRGRSTACERRTLILPKDARLCDLAPVGYCTVSDSEHILQANLTAATLLGMPCAELVGKPIQRFIASADHDIYDRHCQNLMQSGLPQSCELRLIKPDGSHFWAQLIATEIQGASRHAVHRLVLTDINDRKMAQERIRISDLALKAITQGVLVTTPELCVVSVNEAFLSMTGYTECELLGADCSLFNGPHNSGEIGPGGQGKADVLRSATSLPQRRKQLLERAGHFAGGG